MTSWFTLLEQFVHEDTKMRWFLSRVRWEGNDASRALPQQGGIEDESDKGIVKPLD